MHHTLTFTPSIDSRSQHEYCSCTWRAPYCLGFDMNRLAIPTLIGLTLPSHTTFVYKHGDTTRPSPKLGFVVEPAPSLLYHSFTSHLALSMSPVFCMCLVSLVFLSSRNSIDLSCIPFLHLEPPSTRTSTPSFGPPWSPTHARAHI